MKLGPITKEEARKAGYTSITHTFKRSERHLMNSITRQLGDCDWILVRVNDGIEVWRRKDELLRGDEGKALSAGQIKKKVGSNKLERW